MNVQEMNKVANRKLAERIGHMLMAEVRAETESEAMFEEIDRLTKQVETLAAKPEAPQEA